MLARTKYLVVGLMGIVAATAWTDQARAQSPGIYLDYYTPQFYMDYLVFYDENGTPIFYDNDTAYSVPADYPYFNELVAHYQQNLDAYLDWFEEVGYANLNYRRPLTSDYYKPQYYLDYPVFFDDTGMPVYYVDGVLYPVPSTYARYDRLIRHYRKKHAHYRRWYQAVGRHYLWYRKPIDTDYYHPLYHKGYLVYFDDSGLPYFYRGSRLVYIPATHRHYDTYVNHYRTNRAQYSRWYQNVGNRHHEYRQPATYRRRAVNPRAPRAVHGRTEQRSYPRGMRERARQPVVQPRHPEHIMQPKQPEYRDREMRPGQPERRDRETLPGQLERRDREMRPGPPGHRGDELKPGQPERRDREIQPGPPGRRGGELKPGQPERRDREIQLGPPGRRGGEMKPGQPERRDREVQPSQPGRRVKAKPRNPPGSEKQLESP